MLKRAAVYLLLLSCMAGIAAAQAKDEVKETKFYRLDLVVKEVEDGRTINSRTYSTIGSTDHDGSPSVRTGSKIAVNYKASGELTYIDLGVNVDYRGLKDLGDSVAMIVTVEATSIANPEALTSSDHVPPVIRQNRWSSNSVVPLRKATTLFSSDDATSKRKLQVELTATPIKP